MGVKSKTIHSLSQALGTGVVFLELQFNWIIIIIATLNEKPNLIVYDATN